MIVDEFRSAIAVYEDMLREGRTDPWDMLNIVDKKLAEISNHIAVCHRVIGEHRAYAQTAFFGGARKHLDRAERAGLTLDQVISVQGELFEFRYKVLRRIADTLKNRT